MKTNCTDCYTYKTSDIYPSIIYPITGMNLKVRQSTGATVNHRQSTVPGMSISKIHRMGKVVYAWNVHNRNNLLAQLHAEVTVAHNLRRHNIG